MVGLLVRLAQSVGLHRDGSCFPHLSPFEVEMRRRLWWQICFLDARLGDHEVSEILISETSFDTQKPTNIDDDHLDPGMLERPVEQHGYTDLTPCIFRCELWFLGRKLRSAASKSRAEKEDVLQVMNRKLGLLDQFRADMSSLYLNSLSPDQPIQLLLSSVMRLSFTRLELIVRHVDIFGETDSGLGGSEGEKSLASAIANLDRIHELRNHPSTRRWTWIFDGCIQWHALGVALVQLCTRPWGPMCEHAWNSIQETFSGIEESTARMSLYHPIYSLANEVRKHRSEEIKRLQANPPILRQLNNLASRQSLVFQSSEVSVGPAGFNTIVTEQKLALEKDTSNGNVVDSTVSNEWVGNGDITLDWIEIGNGGGQAASNNLVDIFNAEPETSYQRTKSQHAEKCQASGMLGQANALMRTDQSFEADSSALNQQVSMEMHGHGDLHGSADYGMSWLMWNGNFKDSTMPW
jgi:hypothetical protein